VLVAEDDPEMRFLVARALRKDGYDVVEVGDGDALMLEVTNRLMRFGVLSDVDLVVTDVRMPGRDGLEIAEVLRGATYRVPLILMTGFGDDEIRRRAASLGAVLFDKPFRLEDLRAAAVALVPPMRA
jgi:DNA-binding response OmpR family regulator